MRQINVRGVRGILALMVCAVVATTLVAATRSGGHSSGSVSALAQVESPSFTADVAASRSRCRVPIRRPRGNTSGSPSAEPSPTARAAEHVRSHGKPGVPPVPPYEGTATPTPSPRRLQPTVPAPALPTTKITGTVVDAKTGEKVSGVSITASHQSPATSAADGDFSLAITDFAALPKDQFTLKGVNYQIGRIDVTVSAPSYGDFTIERLDVYCSNDVSIEVELTKEAQTQNRDCLPFAVRAFKKECASTPDHPQQPAVAKVTPTGTKLAAPIGSCSGFDSSVQTPSTIRVYENWAPPGSQPDYQIHVLDFKTYVKESLDNEWINSWDMESLQFGAMAVREYAWYYVNHGPAGWIAASATTLPIAPVSIRSGGPARRREPMRPLTPSGRAAR